MEERIQKRIAELEKAAEQKRLELLVISNLLSELRALIAPAAPTLSGDPL